MARKKYTVIYLSSILLGLSSMLFVGCKKGFDVPPASASVRIANVISDVPFMVTSFQGIKPLEFYNTAARINYGSSNAKANYVNVPAGTCELAMYRFQDTLKPGNPFFQVNLNLLPNCYYSFFLTGTASAPDTLFLKEQFDPIIDSATGIRFINLSPGSEPMTVNLVGQSIGSEVADLSYKSPSTFIVYPANSMISSYTFEFRSKRTGDVITSYTASGINANSSQLGAPKNFWLFRRATLMVTGIPGGSGLLATKVELINHI